MVISVSVKISNMSASVEPVCCLVFFHVLFTWKDRMTNIWSYTSYNKIFVRTATDSLALFLKQAVSKDVFQIKSCYLQHHINTNGELNIFIPGPHLSHLTKLENQRHFQEGATHWAKGKEEIISEIYSNTVRQVCRRKKKKKKFFQHIWSSYKTSPEFAYKIF